MKKSTILIITVVVLAFAIVAILLHKTVFVNDKPVVESNDSAAKQTEPVQENKDPLSEDNVPAQEHEVDDKEKPISDIVEIPVDSVKGITQQEAEELCYSVLGEKDADTGFIFSFGVSGAVETAGKQYYVIRASWLVNNSHMSYIGNFFVSADGNELYNGVALSGEYEILNIIWKK